MRSTTIRVSAFFILLLLFGSAFAQQAVDESKITEMRATIQKLEGLSGDQNIPVEMRQNLSELLFEKRGELHALLRQKRDALRSALLNATSDQERTGLNDGIRQVSEEMQRLSGASASGATATTTPETTTLPSAPTTPRSSIPAVGPPATPQPTPVLVSLAAGDQQICDALFKSRPPAKPDYNREIQIAACRLLYARAGKFNANERELDYRSSYSMPIALGLAGVKVQNIAVPEFTAQAENASNAKDVSASSSSSGSTSLVSKAGIPAVFGFAVENGALTKATSGTTVTFTGNPVGIVEALAKKGFITSFQNQAPLTAALRRVSFGISFDTSRGDQSGAFTADKQQLSGFSFKYNVIDQRDPRQSRYTKRWQELTRIQASNLATAMNNFVIAIVNPPPAFKTWLDDANSALIGKSSLEEIERTLLVEFAKLPDLELPTELQQLVKQVASDYDELIKERNNILDEISNGWIATFDYHNERPLGLPTLSNFRFLAEKGAYNGSIDFTGNASVTIYNSRPTTPNTQRLRDFRFAGQLDVPFGDVSRTGKFLLSFAGRYERLLNDELLAGTNTTIKKGDIAVGQLKLTIPIRGTAVKIPLSVSFANRTELIQEKEVRGNFGITFDLDSILAKFNPFSKP